MKAIYIHVGPTSGLVWYMVGNAVCMVLGATVTGAMETGLPVNEK